MDAIIDALSETQKNQLHEVADLMLAIYRTLVHMRYLDPSWIDEGPHDIDIPFYQSLHLDPSIIYLYSILPYIGQDSDKLEFFQGGGFVDFRKFDDISRGRDPLFGDSEEDAMRPWMTPLSNCGNHRSAIIYSARKHSIWILDQMGGSTDHNIHERWETVENDGENNQGDGGDQNSQEAGPNDEMGVEYSDHIEILSHADARDYDSDSDDGMIQSVESVDGRSSESDSTHETDDNTSISEGDEEISDYNWDEDDYEEDDEALEGIYDEEDCRSAPHVLHDIITWFRTLKETPGSTGEHVGSEWDPEVVIPLYAKHGWPDNFDGDAFEMDQLRSLNVSRAERDSKSSLREVEGLKRNIEWANNTELPALRERMASVKTSGEEWLTRWRICEAEIYAQALMTSLPDAEEKLQRERECLGGKAMSEGDLPIWEAKAALVGLGYHRGRLKQLKAEVEQKEKNGDAKEDLQRAINKLSYAEKRLALYEKVYEATREDAEHLCPGRSLPVRRGEATGGFDLDAGLQEIERSIRDGKTEISCIREWVKGVPDDAEEARKMAGEAVIRMEGFIESYERRKKFCEEEYKEL